jgi:hypothetical protein
MLFAETIIVDKRRESVHISNGRGMGKPVIQWVCGGGAMFKLFALPEDTEAFMMQKAVFQRAE